MSDFEFNIAKGRTLEFLWRVNNNDPAPSALIVVLVKSAGLEADGTLKDYDTLSALLAGTTDECDFTNYARKTLTDADVIDPAPDDTNDRQDGDIPDQTWTSAGGATNNTVGKLLICYDADTGAGTDANIIPLTAHDFVVTTDGTNLVAQVPTSGFFGAT